MYPHQPDYLETYKNEIDWLAIKSVRDKGLGELKQPRYQSMLETLKPCQAKPTKTLVLDQPTVKIGAPGDVSHDQLRTLEKNLRQFIPWKKGPFEIFGIHVDGEWRSDQKWERISNVIAPITGHRVADIGCHNGYFMYRMAAQNPKLVVGIEPNLKHYISFNLLQRFAQVSHLYLEPFGVECIDLYPRFFDTVFCLGILYHHPDPIGILRQIKCSLKPKGQLIIDCQGIPGEESTALFPAGRYAQARGIWFLPTKLCLINWLKRAGFTSIDVFYAAPLSPAEQRATAWAPIKSLADFLQPGDPKTTIEGYPAPWRFYCRAKPG